MFNFAKLPGPSAIAKRADLGVNMTEINGQVVSNSTEVKRIACNLCDAFTFTVSLPKSSSM